MQFNDGLIRVAFDKSQVTGKNCKVKVSGNLLKSNIMTSNTYFKISDSDIQGFADMKPNYWLFNINDDVSLIL